MKTASISILVNGSPTNEFSPQRGLRQGDLLAPFLFNIVAEGLTGLMREAQEKNLFEGFKVGRNEDINLLQYANNTIFFGKTSLENVKAIKVMLRSFELVSSLRINFAKSKFGAIGMSHRWIQSVANYLSCRLLSVPFSYLGIPIGVWANPRHSKSWDPIVQRCERKLSKWNQRYISFGGRVSLIKPVLNSIPIFFFSFFRVPKKLAKRLVTLQQWFLWEGKSNQQKVA